jgi:excisionase family DNA binding protein
MSRPASNRRSPRDSHPGETQSESVASLREILTVAQAAAYLQLHKVSVYKYIRAGVLPAARLGKVYRLHRRDVIRFLQSRRAASR